MRITIEHGEKAYKITAKQDGKPDVVRTAKTMNRAQQIGEEMRKGDSIESGKRVKKATDTQA